MGILDGDYDIWSGKKIKHKRSDSKSRINLRGTKNNFAIPLNSVPLRISWANTKSPNSNKRKAIPKSVRDTVWKIYNGNKMQGKCYVCKEPISYKNFDLGHVIPIARGGSNRIKNLRPICRSCNNSIGTQNLEAFKKKYYS